jgi:hypothetical protein
MAVSRGVALLVALAMLLTAARAAAQVPDPPRAPGPINTCQGETEALLISAAILGAGFLIEVRLTLHNRTQGPIVFDPSRVVLDSPQAGQFASLTVEQAREVIRNPAFAASQVLSFGLFGLLNVAAFQDRWIRYVDATIIKRQDVAAGGTLRGSLFFRHHLSISLFKLAVEALAGDPLQPLPAVRLEGCRLLDRPVPAATPTPRMKVFATRARAVAGPLAVNVSAAEFDPEFTALVVAIENGADADADLVIAIGGAELVANTGKSYVIRILRSTVPERIAPRSTAQGRLVFEPLPVPPAVAAATLVLPGVRVGEATHDLKVEVRF